jgi:uncharacterized membrane protein YgcG
VLVKTVAIFVVLIAIAGYFVYRYVNDSGDCPKSPTTGQCVGTTTGYETPAVRGGGGRSGGGGGGQTITVGGP